nr:formamidopyrimidine-dna glycosylase [Quercus suber]
MPEIGEVARVVHHLRKHLVNRTVASVTAFPDDIVYGKVACSSDAFQKAVTGRKVMSADQQGKYFYMTFDRPPHAVMHLGMTGWVKFDVEDTFYYGRENGKEKKETDEWPPKYAKFVLAFDKDGERDPVQAAFVDPRRLARIRLVDCDADDIRNQSPLKENGPDPVRDKDIVTVEWLTQLLGRKRIPVKALLLDQANLSGVGNWVADETLYQARLHPEQYSNTFTKEQTKRLWEALMYVCTTAVECLGDSKLFPKDWLMMYRWGMGKKDANVLPNGDKIVHLKVGGRTSAIVPSVQKKTAAVAGDADEAEQGDEDAEEDTKKAAKGRKRKPVEDEDEADAVHENQPAKKGRGRRAKVEAEDIKEENSDGKKKVDVTSVSKKSASKREPKSVAPGTRRSTRNKSS